MNRFGCFTALVVFAATIPLAALCTPAGARQDGTATPTATPPAPPASTPAANTTPEPDRAALERDFAALLSNSQLVGYFTTRGHKADTPLSEDRYTLGKVERLPDSDDLWRFEARIQYGDSDVTVPLVLEVKWAGDTPVITLTDYLVPGMGRFTARVLFYNGEYAGTWSGANHGGQMFGKVVSAKPASGEQPVDAEKPAEPPAPADDATRPDASTTTDKQPSAFWPSFRGPFARGYDDSHPLPDTWNVATGENILWKTPIDGLAHSSPVIHGDRIYLTTATKEGEAELRVGLYGDVQPVKDDSVHQFRVLCLNRADGSILWEKTAWEGVPEIKRHPKGSHAASTPATDGRHVVAFFGSEGLYCYTAAGDLLWSRDLGTLDSGFFMMPEAQWGFASSPIIFNDRVIVQCDVQEGSFLAALDLATGEEIWRTPRAEEPTWCTPTIHVDGDRTQVICNGWKHIGGYDLADGSELWKLVGGGDIPVPTPVVHDDLIYITNAHGRMAPIYAIRTDASGTLEMPADGTGNRHIAWAYSRRGNYMQTPLVYKGLAYFCSDAGILSCYDAQTGEQHYRERIGEGRAGFTSSPVAGDDKLYFTSEEGQVHLIRPGITFEKMAVIDLGETHMSTPAIAEGVIYFRTRGHVIAVGSTAESATPD